MTHLDYGRIKAHREELAKLELRPCPWCGMKPRIEYDPHPDEYEWKYTISCNNIHCPMAEVRNYGDGPIQKLVDEWNSYLPATIPIESKEEYEDEIEL